CPSEYMIEKMKKQGLILKMDQNIVGQAYNQNVPNYIKEQFAIVSGNTETDIYSVGYMWGTLGIIYNEDKVAIEDLENQGWGILWNEKYAGKIFMKDSIRDSYAVGNMYVYQDEYLSLRKQYENGVLSKEEYSAKLLELFNRTDEETVAKVEEALRYQKEVVDAMYDVDNDKNAMVNGTAYLDVAWSGDAAWAVQESIDTDNGVNLNFFIPYEGTNVWFDGWVIPKYAKNVKAANEFVAYLLRPDVSITIMDYIGYPSVVSGDEVYDYAIETAFDFDVERDASYFFEGKEPAVISHMKYPDISQVSSAAVMRDFGDANSRINDMWATVKGNTLTPIIIIVDSLVGIALIFMLYKKIKSLIKRYK
ncbi:MAG: extracellular solute-binding protein, partial [Clostridia bacterium]|nr:extracellular solute-binding protein [Clostridia bacterium]